MKQLFGKITAVVCTLILFTVIFCSSSCGQGKDITHYIDEKSHTPEIQADAMDSTYHPDLSKKDQFDPYRHYESPKLNYNRLAISTSALLTLNWLAYQPFKDAWWEEERTSFHFYKGWRRSTGSYDFAWDDQLYGYMDKLGHFYSSRLLSEQLTALSQWIGFEHQTSKIIGPVLSSLLMLEIEIYDGYFKDWGFSLADFAANELGAFSPLLEEQFPYLKKFQLRMSYQASTESNSEDTFIKNYSGMTFWLSWDFHSVLPDKIKPYHPEWLNISFGYSVSELTHGDIQIYLAPDINWVKLLPGNSPLALHFKKALNYLHFPTFALQLTPKYQFHPFYY